jgi:hypothetical protein
MGRTEEGKAAFEHCKERGKPLVDGRTVQLLETSGLTRSPDANIHHCHNGPKPIDGEDSQSNALNPARRSD